MRGSMIVFGRGGVPPKPKAAATAAAAALLPGEGEEGQLLATMGEGEGGDTIPAVRGAMAA